MLLAPLMVNRKGEHIDLLNHIQALGFTKVRIDGTLYNLGKHHN